MKISAKEIETVSALEPFKRYQYFLKRVADFQKLYSLKSREGNWAISVVEDNTLFPFWSAKEYAVSCQVGDWANFDIVEITTDEFEEELVSLIDDSGYLINVFPVRDKTGFVVTLDEFIRDLNEEMKKYL